MRDADSPALSDHALVAVRSRSVDRRGKGMGVIVKCVGTERRKKKKLGVGDRSAQNIGQSKSIRSKRQGGGGMVPKRCVIDP